MALYDPIDFEQRLRRTWSPPPRLNLSDWADKKYKLPPEDPNAGDWRSLPYQRGIMDAITDPRVEQVTVKKSARVGYSKLVIAAIAYHIVHDPCPIMVVQPTVDDAEGYSKEDIAPMLAIPCVAALLPDSKAKDSGSTILHKKFPGGVLALVGANSPRGFRRVSRRVVIFEEPDGYPLSAGAEGDQIRLGKKRADFFWNKKFILGGTPTIEGRSRTETEFLEGDQRYFHVPCPHCLYMDRMVFRRTEGEGGHWMHWPEGRPQEAYFVCSDCQQPIEHKHKRWMIERGEWVATKPFDGHASFHIWAAYSYSPSAEWGMLAQEFLDALRAGTEALKTFVNLTLGECWIEKGEAPEWKRLFERREQYPIGSIPKGGLLLVAGADVQKDRIEWEIVAYGRGKESWSVDCGVETGDTAGAEIWKRMDAMLERDFVSHTGVPMKIAMIAVDANYNTQHVYNWCRQYPMTRVAAVRGDPKTAAGVFLKGLTNVDININGQHIKSGYKAWNLGVSVGKTELYGWLKLEKPTNPEDPYPPGYCHFPEYGTEFFEQITAEQLIVKKKKSGHVEFVWEVIPGRRNEGLDRRNYARAAAAIIGLDRFSESDWQALEAQIEPRTKPRADRAAGKPAGWIERKPGGWLKRD